MWNNLFSHSVRNNLIISFVILIIGLIPVCFHSIELSGFEWVRFYFKFISLLWLVGVPILDYLDWTLGEKIDHLKGLKRIFHWILFAGFISFLIPLVSAFNTEFYGFILKHNFVYLGILFWTLYILKRSDKKIAQFIGEQTITVQNDIIIKEEVMKSLIICGSPTKDVEVIKKDISEMGDLLKKYKMGKPFFDNLYFYADKAIFIALIVTSIFFVLILGYFWLIHAPDGNFCNLFSLSYLSDYYHTETCNCVSTFFEGAFTFQAIISTVLYLLIAHKYRPNE